MKIAALALFMVFCVAVTNVYADSNIYADVKFKIGNNYIKDASIISSCSDDCGAGVCRNIILPRECIFYKLKDEYLGIYKGFSEVDYPDSKSLYKARIKLQAEEQCEDKNKCVKSYIVDLENGSVKEDKKEAILSSLRNKTSEWQIIAGVVLMTLLTITGLKLGKIL